MRLKNIISGVNDEAVCSSEINSGFLYSVLRKGNVKALFTGHDHDNNFTAQYNGVYLDYGNVTGYNCYGSLDRGVRVIELSEHDFQTRILKFDD
ncbi:hypothetical protein [Lactobacillus sp. Sy-1]|uniref:hypothetical protein n=1 Tax=Lactobacillus sp. Sy-1 TaxID=2109645 RepID=UPI001C5AA433|nr:hypothetical protein [Lactobacillus sp. Sy-1]MBW1605861.1 hypothetical protein [Lactobacillus sp. Sy-1]